MASQISHIPYGKKVKDLFLSDQIIDEKNFFVGTVFPDIRYLGVIDRDKSHHENPTVEGLRSIKGDFEKGTYAHALVDIEREKLLEKLGIHEIIDGNKFATYAMKFIEDEFSYKFVQDWSLYRSYLDTVLEEEKALVPENAAQKWHSTLCNYFSQTPNWESVVNFAKVLKGFDSAVLNEVKTEINKIKNNPQAMDIIGKTYSELFKKNE